MLVGPQQQQYLPASSARHPHQPTQPAAHPTGLLGSRQGATRPLDRPDSPQYHPYQATSLDSILCASWVVLCLSLCAFAFSYFNA
ncbi:hypothetical protein BCR44DRAFT_1429299 [Catenaria anguillulae PL171]|uniref:Uncharacterized protein n=1 Tax=Catenaria anguillulae PL171 TaxID=765915 RepID=A0A1Y2HTM0_9FUNG|nr:hypothetical protein BCR44DRAFT_1429299 [Catenaria anguillulae PL171]